LPQRRVAPVMEPGWKSPSSEICWSRVDLSSTKVGNGSGMGRKNENSRSVIFVSRSLALTVTFRAARSLL
jgi:hypothetical protein